MNYIPSSIFSYCQSVVPTILLNNPISFSYYFEISLLPYNLFPYVSEIMSFFLVITCLLLLYHFTSSSHTEIIWLHFSSDFLCSPLGDVSIFAFKWKIL